MTSHKLYRRYVNSQVKHTFTWIMIILTQFSFWLVLKSYLWSLQNFKYNAHYLFGFLTQHLKISREPPEPRNRMNKNLRSLLGQRTRAEGCQAWFCFSSEKLTTTVTCSDDHRTGTLIQPFAKAMARMTKGVDMPKMMMYGSGVIMGFSPFLSPAVCQYLHIWYIHCIMSRNCTCCIYDLCNTMTLLFQLEMKVNASNEAQVIGDTC